MAQSYSQITSQFSYQDLAGTMKAIPVTHTTKRNDALINEAICLRNRSACLIAASTELLQGSRQTITDTRALLREIHALDEGLQKQQHTLLGHYPLTERPV